MATNNVDNLMRSEAELVLDAARKAKGERIKTLGSSIKLSGIALDIIICGNDAWIAENTHVAKRINLETGKTLQIFKGHTAPVTCLAFFDKAPGSNGGKLLFTASWDKTIKLWDTNTTALISSTVAHDDFVKSLFVIPGANLLVSGSSDKIVRFWDLSEIVEGRPLPPAGFISSHTRPVECIDGVANSDSSVTLFTGDTMGIIRVWTLEKESGRPLRWRSTMQKELNHHRTRVNQLLYGDGQLWTASSDERVQVILDQRAGPSQPEPIVHPFAVRAVLPLQLTDLSEPYIITATGDYIRLYDVSTLDEPELLGELDAHWHDVIGLKLWMRISANKDGKTRIEPWIVSTSLDGTIRKWRFSELLNSTPGADRTQQAVIAPVPEPNAERNIQEMTEEEERELAELMEAD